MKTSCFYYLKLVFVLAFILSNIQPAFAQKKTNKKPHKKSSITGWEYNKPAQKQPAVPKKKGDFENSRLKVVLQGHEEIAPNLLPTTYFIDVQSGKPKLKLNGVYYFNPADAWQAYQEKSPVQSHALSLTSFRFHLTQADLKPFYSQHKRTKEEHLELNFLEEDYISDSTTMCFSLSPEPFFQPFYFKKYEVTNGEYREFVNWVRDSIAHKYLGNILDTTGKEYTDWQTAIDWSDQALDDLFVQKGDKRHLNTSLLVYHYKDKDGNWRDIPVYPDTAVWETDHAYSYSQPMTQNYFSHPAFDDYPVVGISYEQAKAFCDWQTQQLQKTYKNSPYQLTVDLPRAYEWEWMAWLKEDNQFEPYLLDTDWNTDLMLTYDKDMATLKNARTNSQHLKGNYFGDGFVYTSPADLSRSRNFKDIKKSLKKQHDPHNVFNHLDFNGVSGIGNNVSEWMDENYASWEFTFQRQLRLWEQIGTPAALLARDIALFYNKQCDKEGRLVYGGSWIDERFSNIRGKNKAGIFAKTFLHPTKSHSTLGFRYVVRVKLKE